MSDARERPVRKLKHKGANVAPERRSHGDVVLYRDVQKGGVWAIIPHIVVSDDGARVILYVAPGAPSAWMSA